MFTNSPNLAAWTAKNFPETFSTLDARKVRVAPRRSMFKALKRRAAPVRITRRAGAPRPGPRPMSRPRGRLFMGAYGGMVGGMVPAGIIGANPTMAAWDYDQTPGLGKSWLKSRLKITSKTFAKLKPSGIFKSALNIVAPGASAAISKVASTGQKVMASKENAASIKKAAR